jgi:hypothetical protein
VRHDVKFGSSVCDLALDLTVRCLKLLAEKIDTRRDSIDDVPAGADLGASIEPENCEFLDRAHDFFQTPLNVVNSQVVSVWEWFDDSRR